MPLYEYRCRACGKEFEELVRSSGRPDVRCPACGNGEVERKLSVFAAHQGGAAVSGSGGPCGRCGDPEGPCGL